ncbi:reverse transcriptase [Clostridium puniceum]|uniref:RNA-directed DNA polymerase n=2 Tax=Clostridium puniceum TaxID=29367 RepID=A0A1S8TKN2_9CLOT|nr:reverse transcriptase [Clostridium puniceum]
MAIRTIYDEEFFYKNILREEKENVIEIINKKKEYYYNKTINKKNGVRNLKCIIEDSPLYFLQKNLVNYFLNNIPLPLYVYGFRKGVSYKKYLEVHLREEVDNNYLESNSRKDVSKDCLQPHLRNYIGKKTCYIRIDIKSFFDSINLDLIKKIFSNYFTPKDSFLKDELLEIFSQIVTLDNLLPQGAVTSPTISNIIFIREDIRIYNYCNKLNIKYSRYADDMLFSSKHNKVFKTYFINMITKILDENGFKINYSKTKKGLDEISLNGFVISNCISLSRGRKHDISKILYIFDTLKPFSTSTYLNMLNDKDNNFKYIKYKADCYFSSRGKLINYLCGYRSFLINWLPRENEELTYNKVKRLIDRIQEVILKIQE